MQLKKKFKDNKSLIESFFSLSILNGLNVLLPLVTLPYILRIIGASNYGIYAYVYTIISYLLLISNYGFNFSATKQIAQNKDNKEKINIIFNSVMVSRIILTIVGLFFFGIISFFILETDDKKFLFIMGIGIIIGDLINPIWLFQGTEKMRYMTIVNVISKSLFTILIFILIRKAGDFRYMTLLNSCGFFFAGLVSIIIAKKQFGISFFLPKKKDIKFQFKEGAALFGTSIGTSLYANANVFILNFFVDSSMVGMYAAAEKIIKGFQMLTSPITQALFPHISGTFINKSKNSQLNKIKEISKKLLGVLIIPNILIFVCSRILIHFFCGNGYETSIHLLRIMSPILIIGTLNYTLGIIGLVNMNLQKTFFRGVIIAGLVSAIFLISSVAFWGVYSAGIAMTLSELILLIFCIINLQKTKTNAKI